jgi:hypothetical protein
MRRPPLARIADQLRRVSESSVHRALVAETEGCLNAVRKIDGDVIANGVEAFAASIDDQGTRKFILATVRETPHRIKNIRTVTLTLLANSPALTQNSDGLAIIGNRQTPLIHATDETNDGSIEEIIGAKDEKRLLALLIETLDHSPFGIERELEPGHFSLAVDFIDAEIARERANGNSADEFTPSDVIACDWPLGRIRTFLSQKDPRRALLDACAPSFSTVFQRASDATQHDEASFVRARIGTLDDFLDTHRIENPSAHDRMAAIALLRKIDENGEQRRRFACWRSILGE